MCSTVTWANGTLVSKSLLLWYRERCVQVACNPGVKQRQNAQRDQDGGTVLSKSDRKKRKI